MGCQPVVLHGGLESDETAVDDGQDNQEDAGARVGAGGCWCPCGGEEGCIVGVREDHAHGHRAGTGGGMGAHAAHRAH